MDPYELMMGFQRPDEGQLKATADALRGRNTMGQALEMTGLQAAQKAGGSMQDSSMREALAVGAQRRAIESDERMRDASQLKADAKGKDYNKLTLGRTKILEKQGGDMAFLQNAQNSFEDSYAQFTGMPGPQNKLALTAARYGFVPDAMGGESAEAAENWWAGWNHWFTIGQRNAMFGATLTDNEEAAWKAAKEINQSMSPEQVKIRMRDLEAAQRSQAARTAKGLDAGGYNPEEVRAYLGFDPTETQQPEAPQSTGGAKFLGFE